MNQTNFGTCNLFSITITPFTINILSLLLYFRFMERKTKKKPPNKSIHSILARKKNHYMNFKFLNIQVRIQDWNPSNLNLDPITNWTSIAACPILILEFKFQDTTTSKFKLVDIGFFFLLCTLITTNVSFHKFLQPCEKKRHGCKRYKGSIFKSSFFLKMFQQVTIL